MKKALSLATAAATLYVYQLSQLHSGDALFLVKSDNLALNAAFVALAGYLVYLSFRSRFKSWQTFLGSAVGATLLVSVGLSGFIYSSLGNSFTGAIKPMDYLFLLQAGIIMSICTLSAQHKPIKLHIPAYRPHSPLPTTLGRRVLSYSSDVSKVAVIQRSPRTI